MSIALFHVHLPTNPRAANYPGVRIPGTIPRITEFKKYCSATYGSVSSLLWWVVQPVDSKWSVAPSVSRTSSILRGQLPAALPSSAKCRNSLFKHALFDGTLVIWVSLVGCCFPTETCVVKLVSNNGWIDINSLSMTYSNNFNSFITSAQALQLIHLFFKTKITPLNYSQYLYFIVLPLNQGKIFIVFIKMPSSNHTTSTIHLPSDKIANLSTICLQDLAAGSAAERARMLKACIEDGFFYLDLTKPKTRGILQDVETIFDLSQDLFNYPTEIKNLFDVDKISPGSKVNGYKPKGRNVVAKDGSVDGFESWVVSTIRT